MPKAIIKNHVKMLREKKKVTQTELANKSGCTRQTIVMLEQERYVPSLSLAFAIAQSLDCMLEEVFIPNTKIN